MLVLYQVKAFKYCFQYASNKVVSNTLWSRIGRVVGKLEGGGGWKSKGWKEIKFLV